MTIKKRLLIMGHLILYILVGIALTFIFSRKTKTDIDMAVDTDINAVEFVNEIEKLGYFKYADSIFIDTLKKNMIENFTIDVPLSMLLDDSTDIPLDYRYYFCDGEDVYEFEGIVNLLKKLNPTFEKMKFKCDVQNDIDEPASENQLYNHKITINGTEYYIFKNHKLNGYEWGIAPYKIAEILNIELEKQGINERVYLISAANEGQLVFLTKELYEYIYSVGKDNNSKPLDIKEWAKVYDVIFN